MRRLPGLEYLTTTHRARPHQRWNFPIMNRPTPTTPPRSFPSPALLNERRKTNSDASAYVDPAALLTFLESQSLDENSSSEDFFKSFQRIQTMAKEAMRLTRGVTKKVNFSTFSLLRQNKAYPFLLRRRFRRPLSK